MKIAQLGAGVFTIADYLSPSERQHYISLGEQLGYSESEIITSESSMISKAHRNNDRVIFDDPALSKLLFEKARPALPQAIDGWRLKSFHERLRYYRYAPGEYFRWHRDGSYVRSETEESFLTFMIYLNDGFSGGNTEFNWDKVAPRQSMALIFPHHLLHQGSTITEGTKYVLRTDVMYQLESNG